jgi:hypothetical protein
MFQVGAAGIEEEEEGGGGGEKEEGLSLMTLTG